jgi:competence protein ComEA
MSFRTIITPIFTITVALVSFFSMQPVMAENTINAKPAIEITDHASTEAEKKTNINTATLEQLKKVKGIGAAKAKAIVEYRTEHGPFKSVDELTEVKGFSEKVLATLNKKNPGVLVVE